QTDRETKASQEDAAIEHEPEQRALRGAERNADTDLPRALRDRIGNNAVDADASKDQRDSAEDTKQHRGNAPATHRRALDLLERPNVGDRLIFVHAANRIGDRNLQGEWVNIGADVQHHAVDRALLVRDVDTGAAIVGRAANLLVPDHADHFPGHVRPELCLAGNDFLNEEALTDGILLVE